MMELSKNHGQTERKSFTKSYHSYLGYYISLTKCEKPETSDKKRGYSKAKNRNREKHRNVRQIVQKEKMHRKLIYVK